MKWSLQRNVTITFAAVLSILVIIGVISYRTTTRMVQNIEQVSFSHSIILNLKSILSVLTDEESETRGCILEGGEEFLHRRDVPADSVENLLHRLLLLTARDPDEHARIQKLDTLTHRRLDQLRKRRGEYKARGFHAAQASHFTLRGKALMDTIRNIAYEVETDQQQVLDARRQETDLTLPRSPSGRPRPVEGIDGAGRIARRGNNYHHEIGRTENAPRLHLAGVVQQEMHVSQLVS